MDLKSLEVTRVGELWLVRSAQRPPRSSSLPDRWHELAAPGARPLPAPADTPVGADWKVVAELFLGSSAVPAAHGWSARCYRRLTAHAAGEFRRHFLPPNQWVGVRPDGWSLVQILPSGPGTCSLRRYDATLCDTDAAAQAARYLAARLFAERASDLHLAESIQRGMVGLGHQSSQVRSAEVSAFHRQLLAVLPVMGFDKPPGDF
jgi:hypothetical protein